MLTSGYRNLQTNKLFIQHKNNNTNKQHIYRNSSNKLKLGLRTTYTLFLLLIIWASNERIFIFVSNAKTVSANTHTYE